MKSHSRKKKTRQLDIDALDNRTIDYTLNEAERSCSCCGKKPYDYMHYLLTKLPDMDLGKEEELESIMPWAELPDDLY